VADNKRKDAKACPQLAESDDISAHSSKWELFIGLSTSLIDPLLVIYNAHATDTTGSRMIGPRNSSKIEQLLLAQWSPVWQFYEYIEHRIHDHETDTAVWLFAIQTTCTEEAKWRLLATDTVFSCFSSCHQAMVPINCINVGCITQYTDQTPDSRVEFASGLSSSKTPSIWLINNLGMNMEHLLLFKLRVAAPGAFGLGFGWLLQHLPLLSKSLFLLGL
jgi:hypothetical protein